MRMARTLAIISAMIALVGLEAGFALGVIVDSGATAAGTCGVIGAISLVNALIAWAVWDTCK